MLSKVYAFNQEFEALIRASLPNCWELGELSPWDQYKQQLLEAKSRADSSHEKTATLKGRKVVNYLKKDFQLLGLMKILFKVRLDYSDLTNLKISHHFFFQYPLSNPVLWQRCQQFIDPPTLHLINPMMQPPPPSQQH